MKNQDNNSHINRGRRAKHPSNPKETFKKAIDKRAPDLANLPANKYIGEVLIKELTKLDIYKFFRNLFNQNSSTITNRIKTGIRFTKEECALIINWLVSLNCQITTKLAEQLSTADEDISETIAKNSYSFNRSQFDIRITYVGICELHLAFMQTIANTENMKNVITCLGWKPGSGNKSNLKNRIIQYINEQNNDNKYGIASPLYLRKHLIKILNLFDEKNLMAKQGLAYKALREKVLEYYPCADKYLMQQTNKNLLEKDITDTTMTDDSHVELDKMEETAVQNLIAFSMLKTSKNSREESRTNSLVIEKNPKTPIKNVSCPNFKKT